MKKTTSGSHLQAREVVVAAYNVAVTEKTEKNHLRLAFASEGGGR